MKSWVLFFLGTLAYFLYKYINRSSKQSTLNIRFWIQDNWPELLFAFIFDLAAVLILLDPATAIDLTQVGWWPLWLSLPIQLVGPFFVGYGGGLVVYKLFKKKVQYSQTNNKA